MKKGGCTYIMTNKNRTTLYIGVTSDLYIRVDEHKTKKHPNSFTAKYNLDKLVWFTSFTSIEEAISHEKFLKGKSRQFKIDLIEAFNPEWKDLWNTDL